MPEPVKDFYAQLHDRILDKRHESPYWLRRYVHRQIHAQFLPYLYEGQSVLDIGCGEGILSCLVALKGISVLGIDISAPNILAAKRFSTGLDLSVDFIQGDVDILPFPDNSFDVVLSSHVLEHLPNIEQGLLELYRVTRSLALIAMPTCLTPAGWVLLGGDVYWMLGKRSLIALPLGLLRTLLSLIRNEEGPNEGYAGNMEVPHVWRFPWVMRRQIESVGFRIEIFEAGPLIFPYLSQYIPPIRVIQPSIDRLRAKPIFRNFGFGSMAVCRKE